MAGLVPAIHVLLRSEEKTWMPGTKPGMTMRERVHNLNNLSAFFPAMRRA